MLKLETKNEIAKPFRGTFILLQYTLYGDSLLLVRGLEDGVSEEVECLRKGM